MPDVILELLTVSSFKVVILKNMPELKGIADGLGLLRFFLDFCASAIVEQAT